MYKELLNSAGDGVVLYQDKFGSSSATSVKTATVPVEYTGTGTYTYPVFVPGGQGSISSKQYSSEANSAICYEQIFTEMSDPDPLSPDWTNFICPFTAGDWKEWSASVYASASGTSDLGYIYYKTDTPLIRAFSPNSSEDALSATLAVDGYNFSRQLQTSAWMPYDSHYNNSSMSAKYSAQTKRWYPISMLAGSETGKLLAAVCVNMEFFNFTSYEHSANYNNWSAGLYSALPPGCMLSGAIQFRRDSTTDSSSAEETAEYTYVYSGTATATASASSIVYNVPSGNVSMTGVASTGSGERRCPWSASGTLSLASSTTESGLFIPLTMFESGFKWKSNVTADTAKVIHPSAVYYYKQRAGMSASAMSAAARYGFNPDAYHENLNIWVSAKCTPGPNSKTSSYWLDLALPVQVVEYTGLSARGYIQGVLKTADDWSTPYMEGGARASFGTVSGSATYSAASAMFPHTPTGSAVSIYSFHDSIMGARNYERTYHTYYPVGMSAIWSATGVYVDYGE